MWLCGKMRIIIHVLGIGTLGSILWNMVLRKYCLLRVKMKYRLDFTAVHIKCLSQQAHNKRYAYIPNSNIVFAYQKTMRSYDILGTWYTKQRWHSYPTHIKTSITGCQCRKGELNILFHGWQIVLRPKHTMEALHRMSIKCLPTINSMIYRLDC